MWNKNKKNSIVQREMCKAQTHAMQNVRDAKTQWSVAISRGYLVWWAIEAKKIFLYQLRVCVRARARDRVRVCVNARFFFSISGMDLFA